MRLAYSNAVTRAELTLPSWRLLPGDALIDALREWLGAERVELIYG